MSDTPETDAAWSCFKGHTELLQDVKDLSRKLERERDDLQKAVNGLCEHLGVSPANTTLLAVEVLRIERERDEAREAFKIVYNERIQMELERNEWKNKAYSHATDYTLMEAKCFRLEQELKEIHSNQSVIIKHYDKLKS
jgi:chromosome segregation ATPase